MADNESNDVPEVSAAFSARAAADSQQSQRRGQRWPLLTPVWLGSDSVFGAIGRRTGAPLAAKITGSMLLFSHRLSVRACRNVPPPFLCQCVETSWLADRGDTILVGHRILWLVFPHLMNLRTNCGLYDTGIYWQVSAISLPVTSSFALVFHYRVAEEQRSTGFFCFCSEGLLVVDKPK